MKILKNGGKKLEMSTINHSTLASVAVRIGKVRLIESVLLL